MPSQDSVLEVVSPSQAQELAGARRLASPAVLSVPVRRIVTFHPGDLSGFLFSLPALQALRESFPGARLCAVTRPSLAPFLRDSPLCDEVWERPQGGLSRQTSLMLQLRAWHPDIAVSFSRSRLSTLLAWSSGAEERAGFEGARLDTLLSQRIACDFHDSPDAPLTLVQALGCRTRQTHARDLLTIGIEAEKQAAKILQEQGIDGDFMVAMCDAAPLSKVSRRADEGVASEDEADDEDEAKTSHPAVIEYSIGGFSSVIGQSGRAAERALQAGVQAVRSGASRGAERGASQQIIARKMARRAASRAAILRAQNATNNAHRGETADLTASIEEPSPLDGRAMSRRRAISQWPAAHWAGALRELSARAPIVLVGATAAAGVTSLIGNGLEGRIIDLGGQLEPVEIAAILRRASLFVGTDSGVLHLAAAVGTPVVGIYGPTDWRRSGPRGVTCRVVRFAVECSPCELPRCLWQGEDKRKCLTQLSPSLVVQAARELIGL